MQINNVFDGSHIYEMNEYNDLNSYFIKFLNGKMIFVGEASIRKLATIDLIKSICKNTSPDDNYTANILYSEFVRNSNHSCNDDYVEVGKLMDKYNIESHELFYIMYKANAPFGAGVSSYLQNIDDASKFTIDDAKKILNEQKGYVDYIYGIPIKNTFRKSKGHEQMIRVKKYDDRTSYGNFYKCFLGLMHLKMKKINLNK